jgi:hypothetical protein
MFFVVGMEEKSNSDFIDHNEIRFYNTKEYKHFWITVEN